MASPEFEKQPKSTRGGKRPGSGRKPGGKNATTLEIEALAKKYSGRVIDALYVVATRSKSDTARVAAGTALLDRGYGRPRQAVEHTGKDGGPIVYAEADKLRDQLNSRIAGLSSRISWVTPMVSPAVATNGNGNGHE